MIENSVAPPSWDRNQICVLFSAAAIIHPVSAAAAAVRRDDAPRHVSSVSSEEAEPQGLAARKEGREGGREEQQSFIHKRKKITATKYLRKKSGTQTVWTHEADLWLQDGSGHSFLSRSLFFCAISKMRLPFQDVFIPSDVGGKLWDVSCWRQEVTSRQIAEKVKRSQEWRERWNSSAGVPTLPSRGHRR